MKKTCRPVFESIETRTHLSVTPRMGADGPKPPTDDHPATTVPARVSGLTAVATGSVVKLAWADNSNNEAGFNVFRVNPTTRALTLVGHVAANATTFTDAKAPVGTDVYVVRAVDAAGHGEVSNVAFVKVAAPVIVVAPGKLQTFALSTTSVLIKWDGAKNAAGYKVLRSASGKDGFMPVGTVGGLTRSFTDTGLTAGTRYFYRIVAVHEGTTAVSATVIGQTKATDGATEPHGTEPKKTEPAKIEPAKIEPVQDDSTRK